MSSRIIILVIVLFSALACKAQTEMYRIELPEDCQMIVSKDLKTITKTFLYSDGTVQAIVKFNLNDQRHGLCKWYYQDGSLITKARYFNGWLDGRLVSFYPNGGRRRVSYYRYGKRDGILKRYYEDGKLYAKTKYVRGKVREYAKRYHPNGKLEFYKKEVAPEVFQLFLYNKYGIPDNGEHRFSILSGLEYITTAKDGLAHGVFEILDGDQVIQRGNYYNGYFHGLRSFYKDGELERTEEFDMGKRLAKN